MVTRMDVPASALEADVGRVDAGVRKVEIDLARLDGRVSQRPTTMATFTQMGALIALAFAAAALGNRLRPLFGG